MRMLKYIGVPLSNGKTNRHTNNELVTLKKHKRRLYLAAVVNLPGIAFITIHIRISASGVGNVVPNRYLNLSPLADNTWKLFYLFWTACQRTCQLNKIIQLNSIKKNLTSRSVLMLGRSLLITLLLYSIPPKTFSLSNAQLNVEALDYRVVLAYGNRGSPIITRQQLI